LASPLVSLAEASLENVSEVILAETSTLTAKAAYVAALTPVTSLKTFNLIIL
jgi:hypothetical protein